MADQKPEIKNPRRILLLSPDESPIDLLKELTGTPPSPSADAIDATSLAGISHTLALKTAYYSADVPVWIDVPSLHSPADWAADFLLPEAAEVLSAIGAFVVAFRKPSGEEEMRRCVELVREVGRVADAVGRGEGGEGMGRGFEGVKVVVLMRAEGGGVVEGGVERWEEEVGWERGWEVVDAEGEGRNEFGEPVGIARLKEALEANDWANDVGDDEDFDMADFDSDNEGSVGFSFEAADFEGDFAALKQRLYEGEDDDVAPNSKGGLGNGSEEKGVEDMERLISKMQAIKDLGADMPEAERKKFAAKAVKDLMRTL